MEKNRIKELEKLVPDGTVYSLEYANSIYNKLKNEELIVDMFKESKSGTEKPLYALLYCKSNLMGFGEKEPTLDDVLSYATTKLFLVLKGAIPKEMENQI